MGQLAAHLVYTLQLHLQADTRHVAQSGGTSTASGQGSATWLPSEAQFTAHVLPVLRELTAHPETLPALAAVAKRALDKARRNKPAKYYQILDGASALQLSALALLLAHAGVASEAAAVASSVAATTGQGAAAQRQAAEGVSVTQVAQALASHQAVMQVVRAAAGMSEELPAACTVKVCAGLA